MSKNIKTFRGLVIENKMTANDIAQLVKGNGTFYRNEWAAWEAAIPRNEGMPEAIEAALSALAEYASASVHNAMKSMEDLHDPSVHHPLDNFGFTVGLDEKLYVEKTPLQSQEELTKKLKVELADAKDEIEILKAQLHEISTWTGFDDVDEELIPEELDIALQVYMSGIKAYDPNTGRMNNDQPIKKWLAHKVNDFFDGDPSAAQCERIATVANWQKDGGRPKKGRK